MWPARGSAAGADCEGFQIGVLPLLDLYPIAHLIEPDLDVLSRPLVGAPPRPDSILGAPTAVTTLRRRVVADWNSLAIVAAFLLSTRPACPPRRPARQRRRRQGGHPRRRCPAVSRRRTAPGPHWRDRSGQSLGRDPNRNGELVDRGHGLGRRGSRFLRGHIVHDSVLLGAGRGRSLSQGQGDVVAGGLLQDIPRPVVPPRGLRIRVAHAIPQIVHRTRASRIPEFSWLRWPAEGIVHPWSGTFFRASPVSTMC